MTDLDYRMLWEQGKSYLKLRYDYSKLSVAEKLSILLSRVALVTVILLVCICILFQLSGALVNALALAMGSQWIANLIVAGTLLLLILVVVALRTQLIVNPITRFVTKLFYSSDDSSSQQP